MIDGFRIFDDIIDLEDQEKIIEYVKRKDIKWNFLENITGQYGGNKDKYKFPAQVHHKLDVKDNYINSLIEKIQTEVCERMNLCFVKNYRYKINWTKPIQNDYDPRDLTHVDTGQDHIAMVYYINDSSGSTCIYENIDGNNAESHKKNFNILDHTKLKLANKIPPKKGRALVFNGNLYHHGNYPIDGDRFIINYNFAAKQKNEKNLI
jgi:hypothetical protein